MSGQRGALFSRTDPEKLDDLECDVKGWFSEILETLKIHDEDELCADLFRTPKVKKELIADWMEDACRIMKIQAQMMKDLRTHVDVLKTDVLESQSSVVQLQRELLDCKTNQLKAVQSTVQETVQAEIKSYSQAITETVSVQNTALFAKDLKKVVQDVVAQEDRSRNVIIFGLKEDTDEKINVKVGQVLQRIGEKPRVEAVRIGLIAHGKTRPVKVTLSSCNAVHQILVKAKNLRLDDRYKSVYICSDRSPEERTRHRQLVLDMKEKLKQEPDKRHFIRSGQVMSEVKTS